MIEAKVYRCEFRDTVELIEGRILYCVARGYSDGSSFFIKYKEDNGITSEIYGINEMTGKFIGTAGEGAR